jgi:hypothetical protein
MMAAANEWTYAREKRAGFTFRRSESDLIPLLTAAFVGGRR